jgi:hypothetical protein
MYMQNGGIHGPAPPPVEKEHWTLGEVEHYSPGRCLILLDGLVVDATSFLGEHVTLIPLLVDLY